MRFTRREFGKIALAGLPVAFVPGRLLAAKIDSRIKGIQIGAITYSFTSIPNPEDIIQAFVKIGIGEMELMSNHCEALAGAPAAGRSGGGGRGATLTPEQQAAQTAAAKARTDWRMSATPATFAPVRKKVTDAGIDLKMLCYNMNVRSTTDADIEYAFTMAKGLGVEILTTSTQVSMAKRLAPFAGKHKIMVGFHGHDSVENPDEVSTEATFEQVFATSKYFGANLDIGHYIVAKGDPVVFLKKHHGRVTNLHLKDKKVDGTNVAWGHGDTPIKPVLDLVAHEKWDIPTNIEYVYPDPDGAVAGVAKCFKYIKDALA